MWSFCEESGPAMVQFYKKHNLSKTGEGPGGKFNGPSIKYILREDKLYELDELLPTEAAPFFNYLRCIRELHEICIARTLDVFYFLVWSTYILLNVPLC